MRIRTQKLRDLRGRKEERNKMDNLIFPDWSWLWGPVSVLFYETFPKESLMLLFYVFSLIFYFLYLHPEALSGREQFWTCTRKNATFYFLCCQKVLTNHKNFLISSRTSIHPCSVHEFSKFNVFIIHLSNFICSSAFFQSKCSSRCFLKTERKHRHTTQIWGGGVWYSAQENSINCFEKMALKKAKLGVGKLQPTNQIKILPVFISKV